jgi:hypothetical protein
MMFEKNSMIRCAAVGAFALFLGVVSVYGLSEKVILTATPDHFDFGSIPEGPPSVAIASIKNTSDAPVEITNVTTS